MHSWGGDHDMIMIYTRNVTPYPQDIRRDTV
jgi:hypothetical protein